MEKINKINLKRVIKSLSSCIEKASRGHAEINNGVAEAININTGGNEAEFNGEVTFTFTLYLPDMDKREELYVRCGTRGTYI